jgi:phytanoyl-CoA hydroxylase
MNASVAFFHATGYLRIPKLITANQVGALNEVTSRIVKGLGSSPGRRTRIDGAVSADPAYLTVAASDRVVSAVRPILGPDVELVENRHNHVSVYPVDSVDRLHRDVLQWSRSILTVLVYLSDCTLTAAATRIVPGSHLWPSTGAANNGGTWLDQAPDQAPLAEQAVTVPARAGDAVLMHGQLYHAGAGASTEGPRIVFTLAYRSADELSEDNPSHCRLVSGRRTYRGRGAIYP